MKTPRRIRLKAALAIACLVGVLPLSAQAVLLVVRENSSGRPLSPPLAVREGISGSLFDSGFIVLDAPGSAPIPNPSELARMARSAGAQAALEVTTEYTDTSLGSDLLRISARTSYALIDCARSGIIAQGTQEATNKDRERETGRAALGSEIGRDILRRVKQALEGL
jgi:hypothetical protein